MVPGWPGTLWEPPPMFGQITEVGFFEKINFLCFGGPQKTFLSPKNLIWPQKPHFWGGHTSKTFWSGPSFWRYPLLILPKNGYFKIYNFKTIARFFGAPQNTKNWFSQKTRLLWFDQTLEVVPTIALVTRVPSDPSIQFKTVQLCQSPQTELLLCAGV